MYTVKFLPGDVDGFISDAMQMVGITSSEYTYDKSGSTVKFTATQLKDFLAYLQDAKKFANENGEFDDVITDIDRVIEHVGKTIMSNPTMAQATLNIDMSLTALAKKFSKLLSKRAVDAKDDFLMKSYPGRSSVTVEPEMTEDLDELVKDSLNLVILLERSFIEFQKEAQEDGNEMGQKLSSNILLDLEDIEEAFSNPELLNFDLDVEYGLLDVIDQNASLIKSVLDLTMDNGVRAPEFKKLDQRVYKWINELIDNADKLHDRSMAQSPFMEQQFADKPMRMVEQDARDPDEIDPDEIHPDWDDPEYLSQTAYENAELMDDEQFERQQLADEYAKEADKLQYDMRPN